MLLITRAPARVGALVLLAFSSASCLSPGVRPEPLALTGAATAPQEFHMDAPRPTAEGDLQVWGGMGFSGDPDAFLLGGQADHYVTDLFAIGPLLQLGVSDDEAIIAPSFNLKGVVALEGPDDLQRLRPFVQGGVGFAYLHDEGRRGEDDDVGFLINLGGGVEWQLNERISFGTTMMFNFLPDEVLDENFFFSWQLLQVGVRF